MARSCVFCGNDGPLTREHVWPEWASEAAAKTRVPSETPYLVTPPKGREREVKVVDIVVRRVCATCNSGWMSQIEHDAKQLLAPMFGGDRVLLRPDDQVALATWAVKTMLMFELAHGRAPLLPAMHYRAFRERRRPFDSQVIVLAAYKGLKFAGGYDRHDLVLSDDHATIRWDPAGAEKANAYAVFVEAYRALFQVLGYIGDRTVRVDLGKAWRRITIRLWPPTGQARGFPPGNTAFDDRTIGSFRRMIDPLR